MPSLLEQQRGFAAALLAPAADSPRMAVYRANVLGNWRGALAGAYPVVQRIVGEDFFAALARDYAAACPSVSGDLHEYGAQLAKFLAAHEEARDLPYLPDVARLEWHAHRAHYAADPAPFDVSRPSEARLAPACALLESEWPLAQIWHAHQDGGDPTTVDLGSGPDRVLVHRKGWRVAVRSLRPGDYRFLERLGAGLGAALEAAVAADSGFDPRAALAFWVTEGVITQ
jgi:uncharacterized protein